MLSVGKLALGQQRYYEQQVAQGGDDYYSGRGEAPGEWAGAGAEELGVTGRVSAVQFNALIAGRDPRDTGEPSCAASAGEPKVAAFDLTFSAPKSVSVLFAVAPASVASRRARAAAHEEAVRAALGYLEDDGGVRPPWQRAALGSSTLEGLIAAAYRHRMSRALDPQLHTHVVAANLARGEDGRYTALHHPSLYRAAKTAGYLYQAHLRALVTERLGLEWGPVGNGAAELAEVPIDVLRVFSQRRAQVEAAVAEREGGAGPRPRATRAERSRRGARSRHATVSSTASTRTPGARRSRPAQPSTASTASSSQGHLRPARLERRDRGELAGDGTLEHAGERVGDEQSSADDLLAGPGRALTERVEHVR